MTSKNSKPKILIIGGGLSGLTLAQMLRKEDIPFSIFERDNDDHSRIQGWAVSLGPVLQKYRSQMPTDIPPIEDADVAFKVPNVGSGYSVLDQNGNVITKGVGYARPGKGASGNLDGLLRCNRANLRRILSSKINVQWNRRFSHYSETTDGITVFFQDGSSEIGDVLVGADGASSRVRRQLLGAGAGELRNIPVTVIIGEPKLEGDAVRRQLEIDQCMYAVQSPECRLFASYRMLEEDLSQGNFYWLLSFEDEDAMLSSEAYWLSKATREEMWERAIEKAKNIADKYKEIVELTPVERMMSPSLHLKEFSPPDSLPYGRVTLMGDAAHTMSPFRGIGCNTAMEDSFDLSETMSQGLTNGATVFEMLKNYESKMLKRGQGAVASSNAATFKRDAASQRELLKDFAKGRYDTLPTDP